MNTGKKIPMRKCIGCNEMKNKKELLRILRTPEGSILPDETGKANGRGAYICRCTDCLKMAMKNRGLERSLKVTIPPEVYEKLQKEMEALEQ